MSEPKDIREGVKWLRNKIDKDMNKGLFSGYEYDTIIKNIERISNLPDPPCAECKKIRKRAKEIWKVNNSAKEYQDIREV